ncbi:CPBP family intramembrane glutamic endopeptidase [Muriicola marianensis]|uniref:CAAX prenyl protease 2/Lysostaphin resistance protein A-like domain-containing protein n=1 Tax=Muriicola marianensis TaxID=1324801 RepID=A0ABQ1QNP9_9FLAO|nr:CPBP family intramembrane glutamic endopeptidase [Muriicola marianensis]GGD38198.1 hypothetical protein GCM10011361_01640 [Muriicola marianensis]
MILKHLWSYSKSPKYDPYRAISTDLKIKVVLSAVGWNLLFGIGLAVVTEGVFHVLEVDMGKHRTVDMFSKYTLPQVFLMMVVLAPVIEEFLFRGPLIFFRRSSFFPWVFYLSCVIFGMVHLGNFEDSSNLLPWAPLLVAPQILMGFFLGFLRVKLGLVYAILMHACHNGVLFFLVSLTELT